MKYRPASRPFFLTGLMVLTLSGSAFAESAYQMRVSVPGLKESLPEVEGPGFWLPGAADLSGLYPAYSDGSSHSAGAAHFNFGQNEFQGDPLGYEPYDPSYERSKWTGGSLSSYDVITPPNVSTARYLKTYQSGQYYFEVTLKRSPHADSISFTLNSSLAIRKIPESIGINYAGSYQGHITYSRGSDYTGRWSANYNLLSGDVAQVWVNFDTGRVLVKKLGTAKADHLNPYVENE